MEQNLHERVERLERRNKSILGCLILLAGTLGILLCYQYNNSSERKIPERLDAKSIEVDNIVAHNLEVIGSDGKNSASIEATRDGWVNLSFRDIQGNQDAVLMLTPSGKPSLLFSENNGERMNLGVVNAPDGKGEEFSIQLLDANHKVIWRPEAKNPY